MFRKHGNVSNNGRVSVPETRAGKEGSLQRPHHTGKGSNHNLQETGITGGGGQPGGGGGKYINVH